MESDIERRRRLGRLRARRYRKRHEQEWREYHRQWEAEWSKLHPQEYEAKKKRAAKRRRERMLTEPGYRERIRAYQRKYRKRQRARKNLCEVGAAGE